MNNMVKDVILDLDNTLIHTAPEFYVTAPLSWWPSPWPNYRIYQRPYLGLFLRYLFQNYRVSIWTAASRSYADRVSQLLLSYVPGAQFYMVLSNENFLELQIATGTNKNLLWCGRTFSDKRVIIDDLTDVTAIQPHDAYNIKAFDATKADAASDIQLVEVIKFLENRW